MWSISISYKKLKSYFKMSAFNKCVGFVQVSNMLHMLLVARTLVSPSNPTQVLKQSLPSPENKVWPNCHLTLRCLLSFRQPFLNRKDQIYLEYLKQGSLTVEEESVRMTLLESSSQDQLFYCWNFFVLFYKTRSFNEVVVNCTEPSPSIQVPCHKFDRTPLHSLKLYRSFRPTKLHSPHRTFFNRMSVSHLFSSKSSCSVASTYKNIKIVNYTWCYTLCLHNRSALITICDSLVSSIIIMVLFMFLWYRPNWPRS
jgi:hypothetical protein